LGQDLKDTLAKLAYGEYATPDEITSNKTICAMVTVAREALDSTLTKEDTKEDS
jgi:hypothetical protein